MYESHNTSYNTSGNTSHNTSCNTSHNTSCNTSHNMIVRIMYSPIGDEEHGTLHPVRREVRWNEGRSQCCSCLTFLPSSLLQNSNTWHIFDVIITVTLGQCGDIGMFSRKVIECRIVANVFIDEERVNVVEMRSHGIISLPTFAHQVVNLPGAARRLFEKVDADPTTPGLSCRHRVQFSITWSSVNIAKGCSRANVKNLPQRDGERPNVTFTGKLTLKKKHVCI